MKTTEILEPKRKFSVYQLIRLDAAAGTFIFKLPTYGKDQSLGGLWSSRAEAEHEQLIEAIKGCQWEIIKIDWEL